MARWLALLRAVNVAGHAPVRMADLKDLFDGLGLEGVETLLQSGNVVFSAPATAARGLESRLAAAAEDRLGLRTEFFVRSATEWSKVLDDNPFPKEAERDPGHLLVAALRDAPDAAAWARLDAAIRGREAARPGGRHAYLYYPDGVGRSKLTSAVIERALGSPSTSRNWNTVRRLASRVGALPGGPAAP